MKKRILPLALLLVFLFSISAQAVEPYALAAKPSMSFSGTTVSCSASCKGDFASDSVSATLTLYQGSTKIDSWSGSGKYRVFLSGDSAVKKGKEYKLVLTWSVNGKAQPSTSTTQTCP